MISTSQKEHLTYTAIGQVLILLGAIAVIFTYIMPGFTTIGTRLSAAETAIKEYQDTELNGLSFEKLGSILSVTTGKEELVAIINSASAEEVRSVIKKTGAEKYLSWLKQAILGSDEDRRKLVQIKQKINSILPTLSPMSSNIDEENINLKQYIKFIEAKILKEFNLDSNLTLGLQGISYGAANGTIPNTIGTFDLSLDFNSRNEDIARFITFVNNSGNGELLSESGSLENEEIPGVMSNPLITFGSFSLMEPLDLTDPDSKNSGRVSIRFYVRGSSKDDLIFLAESIKSRGTNLKKNIDNAVSQCKTNETLCGDLGVLQAFQLKYTEFSRSIEAGAIGGGSSNTIEKLSQQVTSLRALEKEFEELISTSPITQ